MPALKLFGRRWYLASDDLPVPAALLAAFHLVWAALLIVWAVYIHGPSDCDSAWNYDLCMGGLLGTCVLSFILESLIARASFQGSIFEAQRRRQVPGLIYFNCVSIIAQIGFNSYGTHLMYTEPPPCDIENGVQWDPVDAFKGLVWSTWAIIIMLFIIVVLSYNLFPDFEDLKSWEQHCRCIGWCCCCCDKEDTFRGEEEQGGSTLLSRLGRLFGMMFCHVDMTPSDIAIAFALAMKRQRMQRNSAEQASPGVDLEQGQKNGDDGAAATTPTGPVRTEETTTSAEAFQGEEQKKPCGVNVTEVVNAAHYCRFAFAAYGWMLSIYRRPWTGCPRLCCGRGCGFLLGMLCPDLPFSHWQQHQQGLKSNRLSLFPDLRLAANLNREAIKQAAELSNADLCYVRCEGDVPNVLDVSNVLPYFIGLDQAAQEVVLAIRGSLSLEDCIRDLLFEPADLDSWVNNTRGWDAAPPEVRLAGPSTRTAAHSGILEAARSTFLDIREAGVLHSLLLKPDAPCEGWGLVLVGHSLGAGCAFLLGLYLRTYIPSLRCWAFSPPGGLASPDVGAAAATWCTSVVCGKESIPRLTVSTFNRMRGPHAKHEEEFACLTHIFGLALGGDWAVAGLGLSWDEMVDAAAHCRLPKMRVLAGLLRGRAWKEDELFYKSEEQLPQDVGDVLVAYRNSVRNSMGSLMDRILYTAGQFTVPGRVMHLKPIGTRTQRMRRWRRHTQRQYQAVWIQARAIEEEGVLISGRMMADHMSVSGRAHAAVMPDYLLATLQRLAKVMQHGGTTASVGDAAGQHLLEHKVNGGPEGEEDDSEMTASEKMH